jgi:hypothetical protein
MANTKTYAALKNDKHEKFCNFTSAGMSAADAYIAAGYVVGSRDAARAAASKLNRVPSVASRLRGCAMLHGLPPTFGHRKRLQQT